MSSLFIFFFFNDTATTEIYTLSLHDALPISWLPEGPSGFRHPSRPGDMAWLRYRASNPEPRDRKSTRLNSSHVEISYAVFCLKKKKARGRSATGSAGRKATRRAHADSHGRRVETFRLLFFFNDTPTTEIYTLSLHDALPISRFKSGTT